MNDASEPTRIKNQITNFCNLPSLYANFPNDAFNFTPFPNEWKGIPTDMSEIERMKVKIMREKMGFPGLSGAIQKERELLQEEVADTGLDPSEAGKYIPMDASAMGSIADNWHAQKKQIEEIAKSHSFEGDPEYGWVEEMKEIRETFASDSHGHCTDENGEEIFGKPYVVIDPDTGKAESGWYGGAWQQITRKPYKYCEGTKWTRVYGEPKTKKTSVKKYMIPTLDGTGIEKEEGGESYQTYEDNPYRLKSELQLEKNRQSVKATVDGIVTSRCNLMNSKLENASTEDYEAILNDLYESKKLVLDILQPYEEHSPSVRSALMTIQLK